MNTKQHLYINTCFCSVGFFLWQIVKNNLTHTQSLWHLVAGIVLYRASQKTRYRPWFVHSLLFSIRKFKIQINILKENSFSSNIYFVSSKLIVYFWIYDLFSKNPWNSFFFPRMTILRIKSNSRLRVVVLNSLFLLECVHALFENQALFPINPTTKFF